MNEKFAKLIVDHLVEHGVRRFCISPGSRSTPLAYAVSQDDRIDPLVHFDERGMAFHAFGFAKGAKAPVALIVTSGSAVGNLMPAVMEASHEGIPLIILTADRPPELRDAGANQSCDQVKIFSSYVRWECDLPCPDASLPDGYIGSTIAQAVYRATHSPKGPVHLNCMFREPFFTNPSFFIRGSCHYETSHTTVSTHTIEQWAKRFSSAERGVIIAGSLTTPRSLKSIYALSEHLHWPILPDILSGIRSDGVQHNVIPYYDAILKIAPDLRPDLILHLGGSLVSKTTLQWIQKVNPRTYVMVADHPYRHDPNHILTHRIQCDPTLFCEQIVPFISRRGSWLDIWQTYSENIENQIDSLTGQLTEPGLFRFLHHHLPTHWALFLANSMPIRDADQFFFPRFFRGPIFGKRGLSGIDGNIAAAIGISEGSQRPTLAVIGDQTALHDINSLAMAHKAKHPTVFLIVNNKGGGIFSFLPVAEKKEFAETFVAAAHPFDFEHAARMFKLPYYPLSDFSQLSRALKEEKSCLIEMETNRAENFELHQHITSCLSSAFSTVS
jgi:2-succinyl-5-enolpyruvyl-6-hydroxy-3-cyclohexene-1-carboxylate synthase